MTGPCARTVIRAEGANAALPLPHTPGEIGFQRGRGKIGAVDLLVAALPGAANSFVVLFAGQQVRIPHLRFARHEQLQCTRQQHLSVVLTQSVPPMPLFCLCTLQKLRL